MFKGTWKIKKSHVNILAFKSKFAYYAKKKKIKTINEHGNGKTKTLLCVQPHITINKIQAYLEAKE